MYVRCVLEILTCKLLHYRHFLFVVVVQQSAGRLPTRVSQEEGGESAQQNKHEREEELHPKSTVPYLVCMCCYTTTPTTTTTTTTTVYANETLNASPNALGHGMTLLHGFTRPFLAIYCASCRGRWLRMSEPALDDETLTQTRSPN